MIDDMATNKILFIDTVTTGMNPERCGIYRIGGIFTEDLVEKLRFELRMRPFRNARISDTSLWICGESRASLLAYTDENRAFTDFVAHLDERVNLRNPYDKLYIAGFNAASFDVPFLREWFHRNGNNRFRDYFHVQTLDLMSLAAFALIDERPTMPDFHLETAARFLGVTVSHTDKYDCVGNARTCLDMYCELRNRFYKIPDGINCDACDKVYRNF